MEGSEYKDVESRYVHVSGMPGMCEGFGLEIVGNVTRCLLCGSRVVRFGEHRPRRISGGRKCETSSCCRLSGQIEDLRGEHHIPRGAVRPF